MKEGDATLYQQSAKQGEQPNLASAFPSAAASPSTAASPSAAVAPVGTTLRVPVTPETPKSPQFPWTPEATPADKIESLTPKQEQILLDIFELMRQLEPKDTVTDMFQDSKETDKEQKGYHVRQSFNSCI